MNLRRRLRKIPLKSVNTSTQKGYEGPSFDLETSPKLDLPEEITKARDAELEANEELQALMLGPVGCLQRQTLYVNMSHHMFARSV